MAESQSRKSWVVRFRGMPARFEIRERDQGGSRTISPFGGYASDGEAERCLAARGASPELAAQVVMNARRNGLATILGPEPAADPTASAREDTSPTRGK